jgi:hypothetical protein
MKAIHILLRHAIDYAGLFPPAGLDMRSAVDQYAGYRAGEESWALGRFVLPVGRLAEFEEAAESHLGSGPGWQLAALPGSALTADLEIIADFNRRHASPEQNRVTIDTLEVKASSVSVIEDTMHRMPDHLQAYLEIPLDPDPAPLINAIADSGARAKVRTGGVTREAFPSSPDLIRFMAACIRAKVPFKATAGLHHPLDAEYPLTYAPNSVRGPMFGFLNLFLSAAFLGAGMDEKDALQLLEERSPGALQVDDTGIHWRGHLLDLDDLRRARQEMVISFGSCSFTEPISELQALRLLQSRVPQA